MFGQISKIMKNKNHHLTGEDAQKLQPTNTTLTK